MRWIILIASLLFFSNSAIAEWKGVLIAGSNKQGVFDNMIVNLGIKIDLKKQIKDSNIFYLTSDQQTHKILGEKISASAHPGNIKYAVSKLKLKENDKCFIYITSYGVKNGGVTLLGIIAPPLALDSFITGACGNRQTMIVVSACYSGQHIDALKRNNRVIYTASSADRPSFGCSNDFLYSFYDKCFIDNFKTLEEPDTLYDNIKKCVVRREKALGYKHSNPLYFKGKRYEN